MATLRETSSLDTYKDSLGWVAEMAQHLRAFVAFAEDLGLVPSTHMTAHNHLKLQFQGI